MGTYFAVPMLTWSPVAILHFRKDGFLERVRGLSFIVARHGPGLIQNVEGLWSRVLGLPAMLSVAKHA